MKVRPFEEETLVSALSKEEVNSQLLKYTRLVSDHETPSVHIFNGSVSDTGFRISLKINFPQNALPLAIGEVEPTSKGSIIFIKYQLFPATKVMLSVISVVLISICITFLFIYKETEEAKYLRAIAITAATGIFYYLTLIINFFRRKNLTSITLEKILAK